MSNKYKQGDRVPTSVLANRLNSLATAVTRGRESINREFCMRVPAELDHCPDLVLSQAADRLLSLESFIRNITSLLPKEYYDDARDLIDKKFLTSKRKNRL